MPAVIISRQDGKQVVTSSDYIPSRTKHKRGQWFQIHESILGAREDFTATFSKFLTVRNLDDQWRANEETLTKQGYSNDALAKAQLAFAKKFRPQLANLRKTAADEITRLRSPKKGKELPAIAPEILQLRALWYRELPPQKKMQALSDAVLGKGDPAVAQLMYEHPWAFGVDEQNREHIGAALGLIVPADPNDERVAGAAEMLAAEIDEIEQRINAIDPEAKPLQPKRTEMSASDKVAYQAEHGSAAFLELPE